MTSPLEYHISVRHSIPASLALFALLALPLVLCLDQPRPNQRQLPRP